MEVAAQDLALGRPVTEPNQEAPMPAPTNLELLQAALACDSLTADWYDFYGVRKARSDALTALSNRPAGFTSDSFHNPASETALTLFMLANTDGWKQLSAF